MSLIKDLKEEAISGGAENRAKWWCGGSGNVKLQSREWRQSTSETRETPLYLLLPRGQLVLVTSKVKMRDAKEASYLVARIYYQQEVPHIKAIGPDFCSQ